MTMSQTPTLRLLWSTVTPGMVYLQVNVEPSDLLPDLTTVIGASLRVVRDRIPLATPILWVCTLGVQTATTLQLFYAIQALDLVALDVGQTLSVTPLLDLGQAYPFPCDEILYSITE